METLFDRRVGGNTKLFGLMGNPVKHTISPILQNTFLKTTQIDGIYVPFEVKENNLEGAVNGLVSLGFTGFNVTVPFKEKVIPLLDDVNKEAQMYGAVNTVKIINGKTYGYNTDADGFYKSMRCSYNGSIDNVLILGAGGSARSITMKLAQNGAKKIYIANRTIEKAKNLSVAIQEYFDVEVHAISLEELKNTRDLEIDIIVNTTSIGMHPNINETPLEALDFKGLKFVYDIIYNPFETKIIKIARGTGISTSNGFGMLYYQGLLAFEIWNDIQMEKEASQKLYDNFINNLENIII